MSDLTPDFELPADLREELEDVAKRNDLSIDWLVNLYRRGFNAKMGATGRHPYGKLDPTDEGELTVAMALDARNGVLRLEFGKPVAWLALPAAHARQLAKVLIESAEKLERRMS